MLMLAAALLAPALAQDSSGEIATCAADQVDLLQRELAVTKPSSKALGAASEDGQGLSASCAQDYKSFLSERLAATQLQKDASNSPLSFENFMHYPGVPWGETVRQGGLSVIEEANFAICQIPKVASSEWMTVLAKVVLNNVSANDKYDALDAMLPLDKPAMAEAVFSNPKAIRVVFVREVLSRLKSVFLNKCNKKTEIAADGSVEKVDDLGACPMSDGVDGTKLSMKDAVEWIWNNDIAAPEVPAHWLPQSEFCELRSRISEYNVIGYYNKDKLCQDASCVMEMGGIAEFNTQGPEYDNAPFWEPSAEKLDIPGAPSTTADTDAQDIMELKKLFTKEAALKVYSKYFSDIELFNFPLKPSWLPDATGELYETPIADLPF